MKKNRSIHREQLHAHAFDGVPNVPANRKVAIGNCFTPAR